MEGEGEKTTATKTAAATADDSATTITTTTTKGAMINLPGYRFTPTTTKGAMINLPGYRFTPTDEELVGFYLRNQLEKRREDLERVIPVVDVFTLDPWQLPCFSGELCVRDMEHIFYFFSPMQVKEAHKGRMNRRTPSGYWKTTGKSRFISSNNQGIGVKKTLVFYEGGAPRGNRTDWVLHEYRALEEASSADADTKLRHEYSLCKVFKKLGIPRSFDWTTPNIDLGNKGSGSSISPSKVERADSLSPGYHAADFPAEDSFSGRLTLFDLESNYHSNYQYGDEGWATSKTAQRSTEDSSVLDTVFEGENTCTPATPLESPLALPWKFDDHFIDEEIEEASLTPFFDRKLSGPKPSSMFSKESSLPQDMPHRFFEHIHSILILDLSHTKIEFLPESVSDLKNLRELLFRRCERLKMVPSLARLKELRVLDLSHTIIKELPQGMDELVNLRRLDLSYTRNLQTYPGGVLQKLSLLEDLFMFESRCSWTLNLSGVMGGADIKEIISATRLANLTIYFVDLPSFIFYMRSQHWRRLESFRYDIGSVPNCLPLASFRRKYSVQILGCDLVDEKDSLLLPDFTLELVIKNCRGISCLSEMQCISHLWNLKECSVVDCDTMECILMGEKNTLHTMEELILYNLPNLRTLYRGVLPFGALSSLKSVTVEHCHSLKNLFAFGLFQHLQNLEYVRLWMCDQIEEIVADDEGMADRDHSNTITLPRLKELWLGFLREMSSISKRVVVCDSLVTIVVQNCPKLKKLPLSVGNVAPSLEKIRGSRKWWDALEWDKLNIKTLLQTIFIEQSDLESESELGSESEKEDQDEDNDDEDIEDEDKDDDDDDDEGGQRKRRKVQP